MIWFKPPLQIHHIACVLLLLIRILFSYPSTHQSTAVVLTLVFHISETSICILVSAWVPPLPRPALPHPTPSKAPCISLPEAADRFRLSYDFWLLLRITVLPCSIQEALDSWIGSLVTYKKTMGKSRDSLKPDWGTWLALVKFEVMVYNVHSRERLLSFPLRAGDEET